MQRVITTDLITPWKISHATDDMDFFGCYLHSLPLVESVMVHALYLSTLIFAYNV